MPFFFSKYLDQLFILFTVNVCIILIVCIMLYVCLCIYYIKVFSGKINWKLEFGSKNREFQIKLINVKNGPRQIQGKQRLVQRIRSFEKSRVQINKIQLYATFFQYLFLDRWAGGWGGGGGGGRHRKCPNDHCLTIQPGH